MQQRAAPESLAAPIADAQQSAVVVVRGPIVESQHRVRYAVCGVDDCLESGGDVEAPTYLRSAAKPLICGVVVAGGAADRFGLTDAEIAVAAGSHNGEPYHVDAVRSMLGKIGLDESALACGPHPPLHEPSARALAARGESPRPIHNNCSGKHAAILALAVHRGLDPHGYVAPNHPVQREILSGCAELLGIPLASMPIGVDGCGIPVFAVALRVAARFFARFSRPTALPARWREPMMRVRRAMVGHPQFVAGTDRFDTDLMRACGGDVVCKGGAEGVHASSAQARGIGMCVKISDGNYRAVAPFVVKRLLALDVLDERAAAGLRAYRAPALKNHAGQIVGEIRAL